MSATGRAKRSRWWIGMTPEQRRLVEAVLPPAQASHHPEEFQEGPRRGWSILRAPSTGEPHSIWVLQRDRRGKVIKRVAVMVEGVDLKMPHRYMEDRLTGLCACGEGMWSGMHDWSLDVALARGARVLLGDDGEQG